MKCQSCNKDFPNHLIQIQETGNFLGITRVKKCPICALKFRNRLNGLSEETPFSGTKAQELYNEAVEHLRQNDV